jgi:hypothetical protein
LYKGGALKAERKAKVARVELVKRRKAFLRSAPAKLKPHSAFTTWHNRLIYYKAMLKSYKGWNKYYWDKMVTTPNKLCHPHSEGVKRWIPLLRYCGMPADQMWHALSVMHRESRGDSWANNNSNHRGLFQFAVDWWRGKWNAYNPYQNVLHFVRAILGKPGWSPWAETA